MSDQHRIEFLCPLCGERIVLECVRADDTPCHHLRERTPHDPDCPVLQ